MPVWLWAQVQAVPRAVTLGLPRPATVIDRLLPSGSGWLRVTEAGGWCM